MANTVRYFLEIKKDNKGAYRCWIHQGEQHNAFGDLKNLRLKPNSRVEIKGKKITLKRLVEELITFDYNDEEQARLKLKFDEREQSDIGQHLFDETFGKLKSSIYNEILRYEQKEVRILCTDEHIARLPWVLLSDRGEFLSAAGWSIALQTEATTEAEVELPPHPKMLIIAPQPEDVADTEADVHVTELRDLLSWPESVETCLQVASTWEEFKTKVKSLEPDIVYYYGHGEGDINTTHLLFADQTQQCCKIPVADFAQVLRNLPKRPSLAYINCCQGDTGGWLGVGRQLGKFIPAVLTNSTVAWIDAARAQASAFWRGLLKEGLTPHESVSGMRRRLVDDNTSFGDARWMTPVLHCHYHNWKTNLPSPTNWLEREPLWRLKLDRIKQVSEIFYQISEMIEVNLPSLAYIWYGKTGQGVEIFHERLELELSKKLAYKVKTIKPSWHKNFVETIKPSWPDDFAHVHRSFNDMYRECFKVNALEDIPYCIQKHPNAGTILYVCHQQPISPSDINETRLKRYLTWWDTKIIPILKQANIYGLLGISFIVDDTAQFKTQFSQALDTLTLSNTVFRLLDELGDVLPEEVELFLKFNKIPVPNDDKKDLLNDIMRETNGQYEKTLEQLKALVNNLA
ncbi:MAG: hypothetical protein DRR08_33565 [Candidatus Parabeggiatoa sp. nov. 2]|nr:MAG: hypothetical protein B6247_19945 [Beggiatoa sp. 4572_84]RKZ46122.1 MAG: hypothetical protein DRR08_33565 [Gammaproteobacteria bacterium]